MWAKVVGKRTRVQRSVARGSTMEVEESTIATATVDPPSLGLFSKVILKRKKIKFDRYCT